MYQLTDEEFLSLSKEEQIRVTGHALEMQHEMESQAEESYQDALQVCRKEILFGKEELGISARECYREMKEATFRGMMKTRPGLAEMGRSEDEINKTHQEMAKRYVKDLKALIEEIYGIRFKKRRRRQ